MSESLVPREGAEPRVLTAMGGLEACGPVPFPVGTGRILASSFHVVYIVLHWVSPAQSNELLSPREAVHGPWSILVLPRRSVMVDFRTPLCARLPDPSGLGP